MGYAHTWVICGRLHSRPGDGLEAEGQGVRVRVRVPTTKHLSVICTEFGLICRDGIGAKKAPMQAILGPLPCSGQVRSGLVWSCEQGQGRG
jgi:hypothetical protein